MAKERPPLTMLDIEHVLTRGQITDEPEFENGSWRYRLHHEKLYVVVAFSGDMELTIVTAWRKR